MNIFLSISLTLVIPNILCTALLTHFYPVNQQHSSCKHGFLIWVENSVDPDQLASSEVSWSGSAVFSKTDKSELRASQVNICLRWTKDSTKTYVMVLEIRFFFFNYHSVGPEVYGICACTFFWDCTSTDKLFVQGGRLETVSRFVVFVSFDYFSVK